MHASICSDLFQFRRKSGRFQDSDCLPEDPETRVLSKSRHSRTCNWLSGACEEFTHSWFLPAPAELVGAPGPTIPYASTPGYGLRRNDEFPNRRETLRLETKRGGKYDKLIAVVLPRVCRRSVLEGLKQSCRRRPYPWRQKHSG